MFAPTVFCHNRAEWSPCFASVAKSPWIWHSFVIECLRVIPIETCPREAHYWRLTVTKTTWTAFDSGWYSLLQISLFRGITHCLWLKELLRSVKRSYSWFSSLLLFVRLDYTGRPAEVMNFVVLCRSPLASSLIYYFHMLSFLIYKSQETILVLTTETYTARGHGYKI